MSDEEQQQTVVVAAAALGALLMIPYSFASSADFGPLPEFERSVGGVIIWIGAWVVRIVGHAIAGALCGAVVGVFLAYTPIGGCLIIIILGSVIIGLPVMAIIWLVDALRAIRF